MKNLKFKLVHFVIALLIVAGSVAGITLYSYYGHDTNKIKFANEYYHVEDYKSLTALEQIENHVKLSGDSYAHIVDGLSFYDIKSKKEYNATPSDNSKNHINGATWENGVLHIPGWFDLTVYAQTNYNSDAEEWTFTYYLYLFNVNYKTADMMDKLYFCFVDGTGESGENELYGVTKLDVMIDEVRNAEYGGPDGANIPQFSYTGKQASSNPLYIYDNGATGAGVTESEVPYIYRLTSMTEALSTNSDLDDEISSRWFYELESSTFSIFHSGSYGLTDAITNGTTDELEEIVRGTYVNPYEDAEDFNSKVGDGVVFDGADGSLYKVGYGKFMFWRLVIEGAVTLLVSGILAVLYYLIWQDEEVEKTTKAPKKLKAKRK